MWDSVPVFSVIPYGFDSLSVPGDVTGDGEVKLSDVIHLINYVLRAGPPPVEQDPFAQKMMLVGEDPTDSSQYWTGHLLLIKRR